MARGEDTSARSAAGSEPAAAGGRARAGRLRSPAFWAGVQVELERVDPADLARFLAGPPLAPAHRGQIWDRLQARLSS